MDIENRVAIVTGGASGLGFATASALVAGGAKVAIVDLQPEMTRNAAQRIGAVPFS